MQGQKVRPSLYTGIVCDDSSLAPPSGTPRASSPTIIIAAGDTFIPHSSFLIPHSSFLTPNKKGVDKRVKVCYSHINRFKCYDGNK